MRKVLPGDVVSVARLLLDVAEENRAKRCRRILHQADAAHQYFTRFGKSHPIWGNGSLCSAVARFHLPPEPNFSDCRYRRCHLIVLSELEDHLGGANAKSKARKVELDEGA